MTTLISKQEIRIRLLDETYHRSYPAGTKFQLLRYSDEKPKPLMARIVVPGGKTHWLSLYELRTGDDLIPRFDIKD